MKSKLEQALGVSEQDVKDASAGVLKDLKRFQMEKEDDLKRYMVCTTPALHQPKTNLGIRSHMLDATLIGQRRMSRRGKRLKTRWKK